MALPSEIRNSIREKLDNEEEVRERSFRRSRDLIKICRSMISMVVQAEECDPETLLHSYEDLTDPVTSRTGFVEDALTELAELLILNGCVNGSELPLPEEMGISHRSYVLGACDAIGELRRIALNRMISDDNEGALEAYEEMRKLHSIVEGLTYPSGMIQLKRKQDSARASIDRTQGELVVALAGKRIHRAGVD